MTSRPHASSRDRDSNRRLRVAVLGGDGRFQPRRFPTARVRVYQSPGDGGNGDVRCLKRSIKAGGVDLVILLARWNSHSATRGVRKLCRALGIPVVVRA